MRRRESLKIILVLAVIILPWKETGAIPAFARKYGKPCQTCHVSEPKLNAFGELFRANGFQMPGTVEDTAPWTLHKVPLAAMLHEMAVDRMIFSNMRLYLLRVCHRGVSIMCGRFGTPADIYGSAVPWEANSPL